MASEWNDQITDLSALLDQLSAQVPKLLQTQVTFNTIADLVSDNDVTGTMSVGTVVRIHEHDGFQMTKVASGTVHYSSAAGADFRVEMARVRPAYFGAVGDDNGVAGTDDKAALDLAMASDAELIDLTGLQYFYDDPTFVPSKQLVFGSVRDQSTVHSFNFDNDLDAGLLMVYGGNTPPLGFLECDGSALDRTTYADLFAAIGSIYGDGDGSTTFNLPDFRGEFLRGWDNGRGVDPGRVIGSAQLDAFQGHKHELFAGANGGSSPIDRVSREGSSQNGGTQTGPMRAIASDGVNGTPRTAAETRPRNVAVMFCIKY